MNLKETMAELKQMGTAQNVKIYKRHGAGDKMFGVSFANLKKLKKKIKTNHGLAEQLWDTGNSDARTMALMIADPQQLKSSQADAWGKDVSYYLLGNMLGSVVAKSKFASAKIKKWTKSNKEYVRQCGYDIICNLLKDDAAQVADKTCSEWLATIEQEIHNSPNRARHAMLMGLISIGIYKPSLRKKAIAAARRIGKVEVDHGETSCKTPDAEKYILHAAARTPPKQKSVKKSPRKSAPKKKATARK